MLERFIQGELMMYAIDVEARMIHRKLENGQVETYLTRFGKLIKLPMVPLRGQLIRIGNDEYRVQESVLTEEMEGAYVLLEDVVFSPYLSVKELRIMVQERNKKFGNNGFRSEIIKGEQV
jgi:hypothetical protein